MDGFSVGRIFGIPLVIDVTALLMVALYAFGGAARGPAGLLVGAVSAATLFGSILVHELGHATVARRFGGYVRGIVLHGFGGMTYHEGRLGPGRLFLVVLAGPLASLMLGTLAVVPWALLPAGVAAEIVGRVVFLNFFWGAFNLLPMYPLDGGQLVQHALGLMGLHRGEALAWAARLGVLTALVVGGIALASGQVFIAIIAALSLFQSLPRAFGRP